MCLNSVILKTIPTYKRSLAKNLSKLDAEKYFTREMREVR